VLYAQTGKKVWQFGNASAMASVNVVGKGLVYVMSYEQICAIDPKTRRQTWQVKTNTNGSASTVANGVVYVGSPNKHLYALSAKSGREIWKLKMSDYVVSNPVLANGTLYVASSEGYVYAVK
jgi:outer membrane protein assembly factor BamB